MLTEHDLRHFTGSEQWFRHMSGLLTYTEGVRFLAKEGGAYWLIDWVAGQQLNKVVKQEEFQVWRLKVNEDKSATITMDDGNDNVRVEDRIPFTDFPLDEVKLYFRDRVLMLPTEY